MHDRPSEHSTLAHRLHRRLIAEFEQAFEDAAVQGLCGEGAIEYALDRIRHLDPADLAANETD